MKDKNKIYLYLLIGVLVLVVIFFSYQMFFKKSNLKSLTYEEINEKIDNKDSFVLCLTSTKCSHCNVYKPKLEKVANKYDITIYYADVDTFDKEDYNKLKSEFSFDGSTPITIFINDGEEETTATRINGDISTDKIINKLKKNGFIK